MERRDQTIFRHLHAWQRSGTSWPTIAQAVVEQYHALVPSRLRNVRFHAEGDAYEAMRANAQILRRYEEDYRLPDELEEAIVWAMPEQRRWDLIVELHRRYAMLPMPLPTASDDPIETGRFIRRAGSAIEAVTQALADGQCPDREQADAALGELDKLLARAGGLRVRLKKSCPGRSVDVDEILAAVKR